MIKINHNKLRNTGLIYEMLIRQITSDVMSNKQSPAVDIVRKYFSKGELAKENKLYQTLINTKMVNEAKSEALVNTVIDLYEKLNRTTLRREKYNIIKEIKSHYSLESFFKYKIPNYTQYASAYTLFEAKISSEFVEPNQIINNKTNLLEHISKAPIDKDEIKDKILEEYASMDKGTRILAYKMLLEKFNETYSTLLPSQKTVLKEFINNVNNTVKLKEFITAQYNIIKRDLSKLSKNVDNPTIKIKLNEVTLLINQIDVKNTIKDDNIVTLLQYHQLVEDLRQTIKK